MKDYPIQLLKQIDDLDSQIAKMRDEKLAIFQRLSNYKSKLVEENAHLIGKKALCVSEGNPNIVECVCTRVLALDDYESIKPLFKRNGTNYSVVSYEWID